MDPVLEQQINHLTSEINRLKEEQAATEKNVVNLVARSEFTAALLTALLVNGTLSREDAISFVKLAPVEIPGYTENVEEARRFLLQVLSYPDKFK